MALFMAFKSGTTKILLPPQLVLPMQIVMIAIAIGVSIHILRLPTFKKQ